jgi:AraC-binding-like domain
MVSLIRTEDVPPDMRHETWRRTVCDTLGPLDMRIDPDAPLTGEIEAGQLGAVRVGKVRTETPHSVHRTPGLIRRDSPENYRVVLAMAGTHRLAQDGRVALVHTGELAIPPGQCGPAVDRAARRDHHDDCRTDWPARRAGAGVATADHAAAYPRVHRAAPG